MIQFILILFLSQHFGSYLASESTQKLFDWTKNVETKVSNVFFGEIGLSLKQCAALCQKWDEETCHSFNYCIFKENKVLCELSEHTIEESVAANETIYAPNCDNYGRTRLEDDIIKSQEVINDERDIMDESTRKLYNLTKNVETKVSDVFFGEIGLTLKQCAALCQKYDEETCRSFNYCTLKEDIILCELSEHTIEDSSAANKTMHTQTCDNYGFPRLETDEIESSKNSNNESTTLGLLG